MLKHVGGKEELVEKKEEPRDSATYFDELSKKVSWRHKVLLNKPLKVGFVLFIVSFVIPPIVFYFLYQNFYLKNDGYSTGICSHSVMHRVPCTILIDPLRDNCSDVCCYDEKLKTCFHSVPAKYSYISNGMWDGTKPLKPRQSINPYDSTPNSKEIRLYGREITETHLNFVIYDPTKVQFPTDATKFQNKQLNCTMYYPEVFIEVFSYDKKIEKPLFSTARGALVVSKDIWEWTLHISDDEVYGMGDLILTSKTLYHLQNDSHSIPFFMGQRNGSFHGVYVEQTGPLDVEKIGSKAVIVRSLGGDSLGIHFFYGPNPQDVIDQFQKFVGYPDIPPYWALGVHFCRGNFLSYQNVTKALEDFRNFTTEAENKGIPYDSDCIADGLFNFVNPHILAEDMASIEAGVDELKTISKVFLPTWRPHVNVSKGEEIYEMAVAKNILLIAPNKTTPFEGTVHNTQVVYPDYSLETTLLWLANFWPFTKTTNSFILADNWPRTDKMSTNCSVRLIYVTKDINQTLCTSVPWNATNPVTNTYHKNHHNVYGQDHVNAAKKIADNLDEVKRKFILTSSSYSGTKAGIHTQNVTTSWEAMKTHFKRAIWNSIQGKHIQSIPVCGDTNSSLVKDIEQLCIKWYLTSVFLPVFRVTSNTVERHPLAFSGYGRNILINSLKTRYKLLPYYFGIINDRKPLLRPMFYDFFNDNNTYLMDEQFMVGEALIVAPNFNTETSVMVYIPGNETVYHFWSGEEVAKGDKGWIEIPTIENEVTTLIRAGYIVPIQETVLKNAVETRKTSGFTLVVALNCNNNTNKDCHAKGSLFLFNNVSITFEANETNYTINFDIIEIKTYLCFRIETIEDEVPSSVIDRLKVFGLEESLNNMGSYYMSPKLNIDLCVENSPIVKEYAKQ